MAVTHLAIFPDDQPVSACGRGDVLTSDRDQVTCPECQTWDATNERANSQVFGETLTEPCFICGRAYSPDDLEWFGDYPVCINDAPTYKGRLQQIENAILFGDNDEH